MVRGRPGYFMRNSIWTTGRLVKISLRFITWQLMAATLLFWRLVWRPVTSPKYYKFFLMLVMSLFVGLMKMASSSAYMDMQKQGGRPLSLLRSPRSVACLSNLYNMSIARMNRTGESGSPCHRPLLCYIISAGAPLRRLLMVEVAKNAAAQLRHQVGKPRCCIRVSR